MDPCSLEDIALLEFKRRSNEAEPLLIVIIGKCVTMGFIVISFTSPISQNLHHYLKP